MRGNEGQKDEITFLRLYTYCSNKWETGIANPDLFFPKVHTRSPNISLVSQDTNITHTHTHRQFHY